MAPFLFSTPTSVAPEAERWSEQFNGESGSTDAAVRIPAHYGKIFVSE